MRKQKIYRKTLLWLVLLSLSITGCAVTNSYGPYMGKVVDRETEEPLEGAVVFMRFFTSYPTPGGSNSLYADALEVMTDQKGEFHIPTHRIWTLRPINFWEPYAPVIIFKPGYGAYPRHPET